MQKRNFLQEIQCAEFRRLFKEFDTLIRTENYALGQGQVYQYCLADFFVWLELQGISKIKAVKNSDVIAYYECLLERPNMRSGGTLASSTINGHLLTLRKFFDYLLETDQVKTVLNLPVNINRNSEIRNILSQEEIHLLFETCITAKEKALLSLAYGCGMRRSEIVRLNTTDINLSTGILIVRKGKLGKRREIPMSNSVILNLKEYMHTERIQSLQKRNKTEVAFILGFYGYRMRGDYLNELLKQIIARTKNEIIIDKNITLHCLRHSIGTHLTENGAGIEFVRDFLGHVFIDTAHIYARRRKLKNKISL